MKSIKSTIQTFAVLATLIPAVGIGTLSFWRYQVMIGENVTHELRALAGDAGGDVTQWLHERVSEVKALSAANMLSDGLSGEPSPWSGKPPVGPRELELYLTSVQKKLPAMLALTVSDASGQTVATTDPAMPVPKLPATWPATAINEGVIVEPPRWDATRQTAALTVAVPVLSSRNEMLGGLAATLDLGSVRPRLEAVVGNSPANVVILAPDGTPLVAARTRASEMTQLAAASIAKLSAQPGEAQELTGHLRQEVLAVADVPRSLPLLIVAERNREEMYAAWVKLLQFFALVVAGLALIVSSLAYAVGRSIVRPLHDLTQAAGRIARDDLTVQLKTSTGDEIGELTQVFNLMVERLRRSRAEIVIASEALQQQNELLESLAVTDGLTGVYNRQKLNDVLTEHFLRFCRNHRVFAVLMVDIDLFKAINDTHGHAAGDEVLINLAVILKEAVRAVDTVARYGGEEFAVILPETTTGGAMEVAERIRAAVESHHLTNDGVVPVTVSVGVAESHDDDLTPEAVLSRADQALYAAKHAGRNAVRETAST